MSVPGEWALRSPAARRVLEAAAPLYVEGASHGLSMRKISAAAGGSTQLMYTLFGGKRGLTDAVYTG